LKKIILFSYYSDSLNKKKWCQNYTTTYICKILYKICSIKQIRNQSENNNIPEDLRNSTLLLLFFEFHISSFLYIIDNIIYASGTYHQNSNQWQCSIIIMCLRPYHVTNILHCHWREFWSRDTDVYILHIYVLNNFDTVLWQDLQMSGIVQLLRFSGFIFPLQSL